jgi:hypothetical protein
MVDSGLYAKDKKMVLDYERGNIGQTELRKQYDSWNKEVLKVRREVAKKFVSEFNIARLKDMSYKDIERGKKMLEDYNLDFKVSDYGIISKTGPFTTVY